MKRGPQSLVVARSPSHPTTDPARRRVRQIADLLRLEGYATTFLLCLDRASWPDEMGDPFEEMHAAWDRFAVVPPLVAHERDATEAARWDHLTRYIRWFSERSRYDIVVVCDTDLARAFDWQRASTLKVLDAGDTVGHGGVAGPAADLLLITGASSGLLAVTGQKVMSLPLGHVLPDALPQVAAGAVTVAGLTGLASDAWQLRPFVARFADYAEALQAQLVLRVGGPVGRMLVPRPPFVEIVDTEGNSDCLGRALDIAVFPVTPVRGGLSVEQALGWGHPVLARQGAFADLPVADPWHAIETLDGICTALITLAFEPARRRELAARSALAASLVKPASPPRADGDADAFRRELRLWRARTIVLADSTFDVPGLRAERTRQLCDSLAVSQPLTVVVPDTGPFVATRNGRRDYEILTDTEAFGGAATPERLETALQRWAATSGVLHVVLARDTADWTDLVAAIRPYAGLWVDAWTVSHDVATALGGAPDADIVGWSVGMTAPESLRLAPLRRRPAFLDWTPNPSEGDVLLFDAADGGIGEWAARRLAQVAPGRLVSDFGGNPWKCRPAVVLAATATGRKGQLLRAASGLARVPFVALDTLHFPALLQGPRQARQVGDVGGYLDAMVALTAEGGVVLGDDAADDPGRSGWETAMTCITRRPDRARPPAMGESLRPEMTRVDA